MTKIKYDGFELDYFDKAFNFRKYQIELIKPFIKDKFAEVGPGSGGLVKYYYRLTKFIHLFEPEKKLFRLLKKRFKKKKITIKNKILKQSKKKFDTIIYFDVLEHIKKDLEEVKEASKKLNKNGYLIFAVPAYQFFYSDFDSMVGHHKRYNKNDFLHISKKTGLKIEKLIYYDSIGFILLILNKFLSSNQKNLKNKINLWNFLMPLSKIIDFITFHQIGKSLLCVYKKC